MNHDDLRRRAVGYLLVAAVAGSAWWAISRAAPLYTQLRATESHLASVEATTRAAREQAVRSGGAGIEDSIAAARARFEDGAALVPSDADGESDADVRRHVATLAERNGVTLRSAEEVQASREGPLLVTSVRISAEGRYHDVGRWLASVESTRRLVRLTGASLSARVDTGAAEPHATPAGAPATVLFEGTFRWFRRDPSSAEQDTTKGS